MQRNTKKIIKKSLLFVFLLFSVFCFSQKTKAADLVLSSPSNTYSVGSSFSVSVLVNTESGQSINAVSSHITFPKNMLSVVSISKTNSLVGLWATDPDFSNTAGTVDFEGVILNPGFEGSQGKIITINFKVKSAGSASVFLGASSILANDGQGTNVLANLKNLNLNLIQAQAVVNVPVVSTTTSPVNVTQVATNTATTTATTVEALPQPVVVSNPAPQVQNSQPFSAAGDISLVIHISPTIILVLLFSIPLLLLLFFIFGVLFAKRILNPHHKKDLNIPPNQPSN